MLCNDALAEGHEWSRTPHFILYIYGMRSREM